MAPSQVYEFIAAVALLVWDHVITFGGEVHKVWSRKLSGSTLLYVLLRYGTLFEKITVLFLASWYLTPHELVFSHFGVPALSAFRNNALGKSTHVWNVAALMLRPIRIAGIIADILSEAIVITVTVCRTFGLRHSEVPIDGKTRSGLAFLLLRDGTIYFVALLVLSLADMLVLIFDHVVSISTTDYGFLIGVTHTPLQPEFATRYDYWVVPYYTPVFRTILICRFLLMLRAIFYDEDGNAGNTDMNHSIQFASRVIGRMGAPVDTTRFDDDDVEDEDIVYSQDPLRAGLEMMSESDAARPEADDKQIALQELSHIGSSGSGVEETAV
ncbi:hypothetical protein DFH07DRAFT_1017015 [Mycena maculata]|uniref:DUF6533 domain-containing protein n=1 Tax=Mycena maculata TaxID=230809 RepID=A0AAD7NJP9_9AGAR|nr:hypothetical protein DFH07DRAFT_1017015 [Mycena maculata]